jgi:hypothetical protein
MIHTFISFHHANDQAYKDALVGWAVPNRLMFDMSVDTGDIDSNLPNETIRRIVRDDYLRDSQVTIVLCGEETRFRKHADWEIKSSMIDGPINRRSGILVITLPTIPNESYFTCNEEEKLIVYGLANNVWRTVQDMRGYEQAYPHVPRRILENNLSGRAQISIAPWDLVYGNAARFSYLLRSARDRIPTNNYDLSRPMRKKNFNPATQWFDERV